MPSAIFICAKSCISYLEEDTPAFDNLHLPSPVHLKHTEVVDSNELVAAWGQEPVELQHLCIGRFI